ncbi:MAG: hypothetical protein LLG37_03815 [Spirochaetia bacterium]|nr:hypothetical protein [Spirochaetia bacterium]
MSVPVCVDCHNGIHKFHNAKDLADNLNTLEKIVQEKKIMKFAKFAAKQVNPISQKSKKSRNFNL